ncbi:hypothetical protein [Edwardsiella tarda]|uniref:hypothetical protein n=1 Tax=Edwardsiella tarda TaxID=636 RepID=UPI0008FADA39|nr:hypothetical protein [Edwardsiella tarda]
MKKNIDEIESVFLSTKKNSKKYIKNLSSYIFSLLENNRVIEAKHYFDILYSIKKDSKETNFLGYTIAIRTFDSNAVEKFDSFLWRKKCDKKKILCLQLDYYYSIGNQNNFNHIASYLFKNCRFISEELNPIIELVIDRGTDETIVSLCDCFRRNRLEPSAELSSIIREPILRHLIKTISKVAK